MARFRKKPIEIEAVQLKWSTWNEICDFVGNTINEESPAWYIGAGRASDTCGEPGPKYIAFRVRTVHGDYAIVRHGDWVIPDSKPGTFYPCKPDVFAATYEPVNEEWDYINYNVNMELPIDRPRYTGFLTITDIPTGDNRNIGEPNDTTEC